MRFVTLALAMMMTGCASTTPQYHQTRAWSYEQLKSIKLSNQDCAFIDSRIDELEQQLKLKGLYNKPPESLEYADRLYNSTARSDIWSLRIGCGNPDRYVK